jgi:Tfp pilus assembly PilM family ATPase
LGERELRYAAFHQGPQGYAFDIEKSLELAEETFAKGVLGGPLRDAKGFREQLRQMVEGVGAEIGEASLVLPDSWLRLTFTEITELSTKPHLRKQELEWKLKRLVPFRVEELRIAAVEVTPFPHQDEPRRLLLGFAIETLLDQLESAFEAVGIHLGSVTNTTLAIASSLEHTVSPEELTALIAVYDDAYTLSFYRAGEPLIYRYKAFAEGGIHADSVRRDLRMTSAFLEQHFPQEPLRRCFLSAPPELEDQWIQWTAGEISAIPEPLQREHFELTRSRAGSSWERVAPMLGAVSLEVR